MNCLFQRLGICKLRVASLLIACLAHWILLHSIVAQDEDGNASRDPLAQNDARALEVDVLNRHLIFNAQTHQLQQASEANDLRQVRYWLDQQLPAEGTEDLRNFVWHYYDRLSQIGRYIDIGERCNGVALAPDGSTYATVCHSGVKLWSLDDLEPSDWLEHESVSNVAFSPDSALLLTWSDQIRRSSVKLWSVDSHELVLEIEGAQIARYSREGRWLAVVIGNNVRIFDGLNLTAVRDLEGHSGRIHDVAFSPDGRRLATGGHDQSAKVWDVLDGSLIADFTNDRGRVEAVAFADDGEHLMLNEFLYGVRLFHIESGQEVERFRERVRLNDFDTGFARSSDGSLMALASRSVTNSRVDIWDIARGIRVKQFIARQGNEVDVVFASKSPLIAVARQANRSIEVWNTESWEQLHAFAITDDERGFYRQRMAITPNGTTLLVVDGSNVARFDLSTRNEVTGNYGFGISNDGNELITAEDSVIKVYDVETGGLKRDFQTQHDLELEKLALATNHTRILASHPNSPELSLWEDADSEPQPFTLKTLDDASTRQSSYVTALALSPSGNFLAASGRGIPLQAYDLQAEAFLPALSSTGLIFIAAISDAGVLATCTDTAIQLWDVNTGESLGVLNGHSGRPNALVFSNDGEYLASQDLFTAKLWSVAEQNLLHEITVRTQVTNPSTTGRSLAFTPDASHLIVGASYRLMQVAIESGQSVGDLSTAYWNDSVWNLSSRSSPNNQSPASGRDLALVAVSNDGERVAAQMNDGNVYIWNRGDQRGVAKLHTENQATELRFSDDGTELLFCGTRIQRIDLASGERIPVTSPERATRINGAAYSPSQDQVVTTVAVIRRVGFSTRAFTDVRVWDAQSGQLIHQWTPDVPIYSVGFSNESPWVIGMGTMPTSNRQINRCVIWNGDTGEQIHTFEGVTRPFALSPDGQLFASGSRTIRVWSLPAGNVTYEFQSDETIRAIAFAPERSAHPWLAVAGEDHLIRLVNHTNGQTDATLVGHSGDVTALVFSPDGKTLVSGSTDESIRVWDLQTFLPRAAFEHDSEIHQLTFTPDGKTLIVSDSNRTIRFLRGSEN